MRWGKAFIQTARLHQTVRTRLFRMYRPGFQKKPFLFYLYPVDFLPPIRSEIHKNLALLACRRLTRIIHEDSERGGADRRGYKARDREPRRRTRQYVEEPEGAQRRKHAWIRRRSRSSSRVENGRGSRQKCRPVSHSRSSNRTCGFPAFDRFHRQAHGRTPK